MKYAKTVTEYFTNQSEWKSALILLRELILETELEETLKWGIPVYVLDKKNIVGIAGFKNHIGLWFYQGVFLRDEQKKLINAQEGVTKALRQWRFQNLAEIKAEVENIKIYLEEAIKNQREGKELKPTRKPLEIPSELQAFFEEDKELEEKFATFTLSKKREFTEYISSAKRTTTKQSRLQKIALLIKSGVGLNDKYRK